MQLFSWFKTSVISLGGHLQAPRETSGTRGVAGGNFKKGI